MLAILNLSSTRAFSLDRPIAFPTRQILDCPKLKGFADDSFKLDENSRKFSKRGESTAGKGATGRYKQFLPVPQCFQKTKVLQTRKNQDLLGRGLKVFM